MGDVVNKEIYCQLANVIDGRAPDVEKGRNWVDPWVQILAEMVDERRAKASMLCKPVYQTARQIADDAGLSVDGILGDLYMATEKGVLIVVDRDGTDYFKLSGWAPGIAEHCLLNHDINEKKMAQLFCSIGEGGLMMYQNIPEGRGMLRAIPIGKTVEAESNILSHEQVKTYLDQSDYYSVADCACRKAEYLVGNACEHPWKDMCLQIGDEAKYYVRTGRARRVTRKEAEDLLLKAERLGLVHQIFNNEGEDTSSFICNCCGCSCMGLRSENNFRLPDFSRSNFVAEVDPDNCVACGECVEYCNMGALRLGNTFCDIEKQTPQMDKYPADNFWTEEDINPEWNKKVIVNDYGTSPCKTKCPAHISAQGYINKAGKGEYDEALKVIKRDNPFPAVCGRICPRSCEEECTRAKIDESVAIDDIKKFVADKELDSKNCYVPPVYEHYQDKVAVIGSGPAGLSCAYYLAAEGYPVTVFEKQDRLGGMLTLGIPSFRLEKEIIDAEIDVLRELGVEFKTGVEVGRNGTISSLRAEGYKAFYIAVVAQGGRALNVEGENLAGVVLGVDFLREVNLGKTDSLEGKTAVIGGGNVAIDVARSAVRLGSQSTQMFCLESDAEMPALDEEKEEATGEGIVINNSWGPKRVLGENGKVTGVEFMRCLSVFDENKRFAPKYDENDTIIVECSNVLVSIGQAIEWGRLLAGSKAALTGRKTLKVADITYQTGEEDVFAGGDAVTGPRFAIDAIASGKFGAISIHRFLRSRSLTMRREREYKPFDQDNADYSGFDSMPRQRPASVNHKASKRTFKDLRTNLTEEQIQREAKRCLGCGVTIVDPWMCIGCGVCTTKCEFDAIKLKKVREVGPAATPEEYVSIAQQYAMQRNRKIAEKQAAASK